jgi:hypothetical protein
LHIQTKLRFPKNKQEKSSSTLFRKVLPQVLEFDVHCFAKIMSDFDRSYKYFLINFVKIKISSETKAEYGELVFWLIIEFFLWVSNSLWTLFQKPSFGVIGSIIIYGGVRWKLYGHVLYQRSPTTRESFSIVVTYLRVFFLLQICQLVDTYGLQALDAVFENEKPMIVGNDSIVRFGKGLTKAVTSVVFYSTKLFSWYSKFKCFHLAMFPRPKAYL